MTALKTRLDMSAEELFFCNWLCGVCAAFAICFVHIQLMRRIGGKLPDMLKFPAPEVVLFFMYYNGALQSSLTIIEAVGVHWLWRLFGLTSFASIIGFVLATWWKLNSFIKLGSVHAGHKEDPAHECTAPTNPHLRFEHKFKDGHKSKTRIKKSLTRKGLGKSGVWKPVSDEGKFLTIAFGR